MQQARAKDAAKQEEAIFRELRKAGFTDRDDIRRMQDVLRGREHPDAADLARMPEELQGRVLDAYGKARRKEEQKQTQATPEQTTADETGAPGGDDGAPGTGTGTGTGAEPAGAQQAAAQQTAPAPLGKDGFFEFPVFAEPVELGALVDLINRELGGAVAFYNAADLANKRVDFRSRTAVPRSQLLSLLELLLADHNLGLERSPEGWWSIKPVGEIAVSFEEGGERTTLVLSPPLLQPSAVSGAIATTLGPEANLARLVPMDELGLLLSTAPRRLNEKIEGIVQRLLDEQDRMQLFSFPLEHVAAVEARDRIGTILGQREPSGAGQAGPRGQSGNQPLPAASGIQGLFNIAGRLFVDPMSNALLFRGDKAEYNRVRQLVAQVDAPSRLSLKRYFVGPLAEEVAGYGEMLGLGPVGDGGERTGSGFIMANEYFTYYGTDSQHKRVRELIDEFAKQAAGERLVTRFYKLRNAEATEVQGLLEELLQEPAERNDSNRSGSPFFSSSDSGSRRGGRISRVDEMTDTVRRLAQEDAQGAAAERDQGQGQDDEADLAPSDAVTIIAQEDLNQLIVRAPVKTHTELATIIKKLDERRPQVFVEVQIVSTSASEGETFKLDTILTDNDEELQVSLLRETGSAVTAPLSGTGLAAALIKTDYVPIVINWFEKKSEGQVISSPSILVNDNESGSFSSTSDIFFSQTTQTTGVPSTTSVGGSVSAGTTLNVTPQVGDVGLIHMELSVNLSAFGEQPNPNLPPNTNNDDIATVVTVPGDETIVLSGFRLRTNLDNVSRVPIISDLPLIGPLIRDQNGSATYREVYIFITPRVLQDKNFADLRLLTEGYESYLPDDHEQLPKLEPERIRMLPVGGASIDSGEDSL